MSYNVQYKMLSVIHNLIMRSEFEDVDKCLDNGLNKFLADVLVIDKYEEILFKSLELVKSLLVKGC